MQTGIEWYMLGVFIAYLLLVFDQIKDNCTENDIKCDLAAEILLMSLSWATVVGITIKFIIEYRANKAIRKKLECNNGEEKE